MLILTSGLLAGITEKIPPVIKSIILPGWGELSQGYSRGYANMVAEAALWTGLFYFDEESELYSEKALKYAARFAGIPTGYNDRQYLIDIGKYNHSGFDVDGYNAMVVNQANSMFPTDNEAKQAYIEENIYGDNLAWSWESVDKRSDYVSFRKQSMNYDDYTSLVTGLLLANRLASCIDLLIIRQHNMKAHVSLYDERTPMLNLSISY
jgi:hypothetical protein